MDEIARLEGRVKARQWEPMRLTHVGNIAETLKHPGHGKLSLVGGDPGDPRKPRGHDH